MPPCAGCLLPGSAGDNGADVVLLGLWEPDVPMCHRFIFLNRMFNKIWFCFTL
jgi:hypothetical protein